MVAAHLAYIQTLFAPLRQLWWSPGMLHGPWLGFRDYCSNSNRNNKSNHNSNNMIIIILLRIVIIIITIKTRKTAIIIVIIVIIIMIIILLIIITTMIILIVIIAIIIMAIMMIAVIGTLKPLAWRPGPLRCSLPSTAFGVCKGMSCCCFSFWSRV